MDKWFGIFTTFSTVFQLNQDAKEAFIMGFMQWNSLSGSSHIFFMQKTFQFSSASLTEVNLLTC